MLASTTFNPLFFYPLMGLLFLLVLFAVVHTVLSKKQQKHTKLVDILFAVLVFGYVLAYILVDPGDGLQSAAYQASDKAWLTISLVVGILLLVLLPLFFGRPTRQEHHTKSVVYAAICIALSFGLSYVRLFKMPQGGSITLASLLPLILYANMFGSRKGVIACLVYGVLQALQDPWLVHPVQFLLEYPVAFGLIGLAGLPRELPFLKTKNFLLNFWIGGVMVSVLRYLCHLVAGVIIFAEYAADTFTPLSWSLVYNAFVFVDMAITLAAGSFMLASKSFRKVLLSDTQAA